MINLNERKTEIYVEKKLRELGYESNPNIVIERQQSDNPRIKKLLQKASKRGLGRGYPEFIISCRSYPDLLLVIECKADPTKHESEEKDKFSEYAVDGVLLYASYLIKEYNVIAIAISGESEDEMCVSNFLCLKGFLNPKKLTPNSMLSFENYYELFIYDEDKFKQEYDNLLSYTSELNNALHKKKVKEAQRSLLISGILIALQNPIFRNGYKQSSSAQELIDSLVSSINSVLKQTNIHGAKHEVLENAFSFIRTHAVLSSDEDFMKHLIAEIDERINSFIKTYKYLDTIGQFYIEFLKYANNDKGLGIVLTPPHITDLFVELANVNKNSVVLDNCCGTGGFLLSAMKKMIFEAGGDKQKEKEIKEQQLIGIELQDDIFALAISNMVIHGDGKTNIYHGNCFDKNLIEEIKEKYKPTVGLLNPPYADVEELRFVLNNLEMLQPHGTCIAIVPMSCMLANKGEGLKLKEELLSKHTLEAVMSMPDDLFHNSDVAVNTAIMIVTAHVPHPRGKKVWFGYWKNDGFILVKHRGRIDKYNRWESIKEDWVNTFRNREVRPGFSVMVEVSHKDEWCAEAYMETDYSMLKEKDFIETVKKYVAFEFLNKKLFGGEIDENG